METFPSILMKTKNWQNTYGVKRGNFKAYKKFALRRSKKIRKNLGVSFGKKFDSRKYDNLFINPHLLKEYDPSRIYLLVESLLLIVEKNYIFYQESKSQTSEVKKNIVKKKLRKALKISSLIQKHYGAYLNHRINLELKVYTSMIHTALSIEMKEFGKAKEHCQFLIAILKELSELLSVIEKAQIEEMIQQAQVQLRYCKFQLKEFDSNEDALPVLGKEDIKMMLNKIEQEKNLSDVSKCKIEIFGRPMEIDDPKIVQLIQKLSFLGRTLQSTVEKQNREDLFWQMQNDFEEGIKLCHQHKIDSGNNSSLVKIWDQIEDYFMNQKTISLMIKSASIYENLLKRQVKSKPQEFIKICENVLGHFRNLLDLNSKHNQSVEYLNFFENVFRTVKLYNIALLYYTNKFYKEALSLIQMQKVNISKYEEVLAKQMGIIQSQIKTFDEKYSQLADKILPLHELMLQQFEGIKTDIEILGKQGKIALYDEQQSNMEKIQKELESLNLKQKFDKGENVSSLMDLVLENYPSKGEDIMDFIKIPPLSELIPTNPINFDLAGDFIDYKEIDYEKLEPVIQKKGGFFSKIFGKNQFT